MAMTTESSGNIYVCITTNQPNAISRRDPNPNYIPNTTKQHAVASIRLNNNNNKTTIYKVQ